MVPMRRTFRIHKFDPDVLIDIKWLGRLDNWHAPLAALADFTVIGLAILAVKGIGWMVYPLAVILIGSRQRALATLLHEAAHGTLALDRTLARFIATFCSGYLIFSTLSAYKESHVMGHHGRFGHPELDPDYRYMLSKGIYAAGSRRQRLWELVIKPCLLASVPGYLWYVLRARTVEAVRTPGGLRETVWMGAYWALIVSAALLLHVGRDLVLFWFVPLFTAYPVIGWFIELSEHAPLMRNELDLYMTRNRNSHWLEGFLTGMHGESYHLAHHLRPCVPFWRMKELHRVLLRDAQYRQWDQQCGGIFVSANRAPSVIMDVGSQIDE